MTRAEKLYNELKKEVRENDALFYIMAESCPSHYGMADDCQEIEKDGSIVTHYCFKCWMREVEE